MITTVAGNGGSSFSGDGGPALVAGLGFSQHVAVDIVGNLYISDWGNNRIRQVTLDGKINTIAGGGTGCVGQTNSVGDGCLAISARLSSPGGIEVETDGSIYIADHCCPRRDRPVAWPAENTRLGGTPVGYLGGGLRIKVAQPVQVIPKPG